MYFHTQINATIINSTLGWRVCRMTRPQPPAVLLRLLFISFLFFNAGIVDIATLSTQDTGSTSWIMYRNPRNRERRMLIFVTLLKTWSLFCYRVFFVSLSMQIVSYLWWVCLCFCCTHNTMQRIYIYVCTASRYHTVGVCEEDNTADVFDKRERFRYTVRSRSGHLMYTTSQNIMPVMSKLLCMCVYCSMCFWRISDSNQLYRSLFVAAVIQQKKESSLELLGFRHAIVQEDSQVHVEMQICLTVMGNIKHLQ